jgi:hypothetical protein
VCTTVLRYFFWLRWGLLNCLPGLPWNCDSSDLYLLSS